MMLFGSVAITITSFVMAWLVWLAANGKSVINTRDLTIHFLDSKKHRTDGPAVVSEEIEEWYVKGRLHRIDGPAKTFNFTNGTSYLKIWAIDDKIHRTDGPAIVYHTHYYTITVWAIDGKFHREDGPAFERVIHDEVFSSVLPAQYAWGWQGQAIATEAWMNHPDIPLETKTLAALTWKQIGEEVSQILLTEDKKSQRYDDTRRVIADELASLFKV